MSYYQSGGPPNVPPPWSAEWDDQSQRYYYVNQQSGERTWDFPSGGDYGYGATQAAGYEVNRAEQRYDYDRDRLEGTGNRAENYVDNKVYNGVQNVEDFPDNTANWTGNKISEVENIPQDVEGDWDRGKDDVEGWAGRKVDEVEDIPEDVAGWAGRKVDEVEDIPEDVAGWAGDKVGDVERFGDRVEGFGDGIENSYDQGRNEGRYDDDGY